MAGRKSVARWRDWIEWQDVHAGLYSSDISDQQRAISRVAAWRSRGDVPISVNATAQLVEISVHEHMAAHQHHGIGVSMRSHMELSLQYATAIVRCVNGLVDCSQKGTYAMAVSALAQRIGIPLWIVDLRHESTHNQLPSLPVLRFAANHLLAWLRSNYWLKQEDVIRLQVRQVAEALIHRLPLSVSSTTAGTASDDPMAAAATTTTALKEIVETDKLRDIMIPLLVVGHQYGEHLLPTGALFMAEYVPENGWSSGQSEAELLVRYPKDELIKLVLELQTMWRSTSGCLLAALCQMVVQAAEQKQDPSTAADVEIEVAFFWIKRLISNEWRERLKYAEEPVEDIYLAGASMVALCEQVNRSRGVEAAGTIVERLRTTLRTCKGIRTHTIVTKDMAMRRQLDGVATSISAATGWLQLTEWNTCPLGKLNMFTCREMESLLDFFPLEMDDSQSSDLYVSPRATTPVFVQEDEEDAANDRLMESLDVQYDQELAETLTLQQNVSEHVVRGGHESVNRKVLPQHEVERIQNQIEIW